MERKSGGVAAGRRAEMHAWFAARQQAKAGDLDAAARYDELARHAELEGLAELAARRREQAAGARASAAQWEAEMNARLAGKWRRPKVEQASLPLEGSR